MPEDVPLWSGDEDAPPRAPGPEVPTAVHERPDGPARRALSERLSTAHSSDEVEDDGPRGRGPRWALGLLAGGAVTALIVLGLVGLLDGDEGRTRTVTQTLAATPGTVAASRVGQVYDEAGPSVVQIRTRTGSGTGFLIDTAGIFVTNAHVVEGTSDVRVRIDGSDRLVDGTVVGTDESSDLAVIEVDADAVAGMRALPLADSSQTKVGDVAIAIGYPLGLDRTVTAGIVSGTGRTIKAPNGYSIDRVIQTDAPINPGNSGGPLLDERGRVIGVNSQVATSGGGNTGIGFAVPSNTVREVVPILRTGAQVVRPYLGVSTGDSQSGVLGAVVRDVVPGGPAERAGLRPAQTLSGVDGDVIVEIDGRRVTGSDDVVAALEGRKPGEIVPIVVVRDGQRTTVEAELGRRPEGAGP